MVDSDAEDFEPTNPEEKLRIFVNRNLRMDSIRAIGFDMDYTLARYRRKNLERLAHRITLEKLIARGYPEDIWDFEYDEQFVIRGLTVDKLQGNILKLDRHSHVARAFHGRNPLLKKTRREHYRRERLSYTPPRFAMVDTLFALPEVCLYADLVDYFAKRAGHKPDYWQLFDDTRECIDEAHRDDTLKSVVKANIEDYIDRDPLLGRTLHKLRSAGKKLFLLTNSGWAYTDRLMSFLLNDDLAEYPSWQSYFETVVVDAKKPRFFTEEDPFCEIDTDGLVINRAVKSFERGKVYQGGSRSHFESSHRLYGEDILYVGDHIYGDILRSKKSSMWRTALIVEELEEEIGHTLEHESEVQALAELEEQRLELENKTNLQRRKLAALEKRLGPEARENADYLALRKERNRDKRHLKGVLGEMDTIRKGLSHDFNPNWGMVFKEERENSRFGQQVAGYACLYTSRVSNFLNYSAYQYFRSPRDIMPHERWMQGS